PVRPHDRERRTLADNGVDAIERQRGAARIPEREIVRHDRIAVGHTPARRSGGRCAGDPYAERFETFAFAREDCIRPSVRDHASTGFDHNYAIDQGYDVRDAVLDHDHRHVTIGRDAPDDLTH